MKLSPKYESRLMQKLLNGEKKEKLRLFLGCVVLSVKISFCVKMITFALTCMQCTYMNMAVLTAIFPVALDSAPGCRTIRLLSGLGIGMRQKIICYSAQ